MFTGNCTLLSVRHWANWQQVPVNILRTDVDPRNLSGPGEAGGKTSPPPSSPPGVWPPWGSINASGSDVSLTVANALYIMFIPSFPDVRPPLCSINASGSDVQHTLDNIKHKLYIDPMRYHRLHVKMYIYLVGSRAFSFWACLVPSQGFSSLSLFLSSSPSPSTSSPSSCAARVARTRCRCAAHG